MGDLQFYSLIVLIIYFAVLLFAVTKEKRNHNVLDYFFAGRTLPFWALSITFIASWWGAGSALATADLGYIDGIGAFWYYGVPVLLSAFFMMLGAEAIRRVNYLTQGEMFQARYSKATAKFLSVMILIFMTFNAASQMVGIGTFFGTYMGMSYEFAVLLGTGIVLIYSMFGGFRGVVLTDIIQFVLLLFSALAVFAVGLSQAGGMGAIQETALQLNKHDYFSLTAGAHKYFMYVLTFGCAWMIQANIWQRISAARSEKDAKRMIMLSFVAYIPLYLIVVFTGMAGLVLFEQLPAGGVVTQIVIDYMPPLLGAFVFIGISAAIMSTMDSLINTGAMIITLDLYDSKDNEQQMLKVSRLATFIVSAAALAISLEFRSILEISWIASDVITTGVFTPLLAGFIWRRGNTKGAMASMLFGIVYCIYNFLIYLGFELPAFWESKSILQIILGAGIASILYIGVSLCTEPEYAKADNFIAVARGKRNEVGQ